MKKLLSFILILTLAISCVSMVTFTVSAATCDDLTYFSAMGEECYLIITDCNTSASGALEIPSTNGGCPVTSIDSSAFEGCSSLTSITIPDSVTSIGAGAFSDCNSLTSITVDENNEKYYSIGNCIITKNTNTLISGCKNSVIPDSVTSIGNGAFNGCSSLTSITIPDSVTSIGRYAFSDCSSLTSITIPDSVTSIGGSAFSGCSNLTSITVDENNEKYYSIDNCLIEKDTNKLISGCKNSVIPNSVTSIGDSAFNGCSDLTSITIPDSVTSIGGYAFYDCSSLTSVTIPDGVTSIGDYAFRNCSSLTSIIMPDSVTSIGNYAFYGCSKLSTVYYNGTDEQWNNITIGLNNTPLLNVRLENSIAYATYEISNNEVTITDFDTSRSGKIELPATIEGYPITKIGTSAFAGCALITEIILPDSITEIGTSAFEECNLITEIVIPDSVTEIGAWAFYNCSALTEINIPASVTKINSYTFNNCSALTDVWFDGTEEQWASVTISSGNTPLKNAKVYYNFDGHHKDITKYLTYTISSGKVTITGCDKSIAGAYFIPDTIEGYPVTSIGDYAFYGCSSLTSVTIPDSVTSIGYEAFYYCSSLTDITIPDSVTSIGDWAFYYCSSLTSITIPDSVASIGYSAFNGCCSLTSVTIPDSVTSIGYDAFYNCSSLKEVHITDLKAWCNIKFDDGSSNPLNYAHNLYLNGALVTDLIVPDGVTSIGEDAFSSCDSLTSITIPDSVTSIGEDAFYDCSSLTTVYYLGTKTQWNKITIGSNNTDLTKAKLICLDVQITGSTVDVGATLTINYFAKLDNLDKFNLTADDFTMRFTSAKDKVYLVKGVYDAETGYYKYPYTGINPQCMNDNIKAELIYNEEVCAIKEYYSVKEYCDRQISRTAEQLGLTETQYNALKTLLADMLVYGSEAQKYKDYNVSELPDVDEWVSEYKSTFTAPNGVKKVTGNADAENKVKSVGLNMANVNRIYFKLILNDENVVIKLNNEVFDRAELIKNTDGTFTLYSSDIKATGFNDVYTLTLTQGEEVISTVQYNVNAYVKSKNADATVGGIVKALSNYGKSATAYANSFKTIGDSSFDLEEDIL